MPSPPLQDPHSNALLILFPGFNTLDVNGPLEVLRKSGRSTIISITIASESPVNTATISIEGAQLVANTCIDKDLINRVAEFDTLIVPGAGPDEIAVQLQKGLDIPFFQIITAFASLESHSAPIPRILLSICTGAVFVGSLGLFNDVKFCTTHWAAYAQLQAANDKTANSKGKSAKVLQARFVDAGVNEYGIRVISSGGISCGMDASLHVVRLRADLLLGNGKGNQEAKQTAELLDYAWRRTEGVVMDASY
ncbi:ThiJ/PfpI family protein [Lojkania enalia]|uniref:ThiJ/PfpI family protein n=1 Tax=Lojkania enalia TaxID=147567 RepID=A0A9P4N3E1_9PLEO|nr:ThiJ/PfpI family protein [Didymosphaeria enalia]